MTYDEYNQKKQKLEKLEKGYNTNATLAGAVAVIILYPIFRDKSWTSMPWYILLILCVLATGAVGLAIRDLFLIKKLRKQKQELDSDYNKEAMQDSEQ